MSPTRRTVLTSGLAAGAGAFLTATATGGAHAARQAVSSLPMAAPSALPSPEASGIDHIVVVMMENRSFDHFLGWVPGADGKQAGQIYTDRYGLPHATHHLATPSSCGKADPDHSAEGGLIEYNDGRCDGWLKAGENDDLAIGYYEQADLPFFGKAVPAWTTCDNYFSAIMAETYPNRFYQHAAQTDRLHNSAQISTLPTIWDRLKAAGVRSRYYFSDVPFTVLWGLKHLDISAPYTQFLIDAKTGNLPAVSFVDPRFLVESDGTSGDDHPHADIRVGQRFLSEVYHAITTSPQWKNTMLVINYDEWGGFYDHVAPTKAPDNNPANALRGFRVPAMVISPRARRGAVAHEVYDHTSVLKAIEWRWNLAPLTARDAAARNIAEVLDFAAAPNLAAPRIDVPLTVPLSCTLQEALKPVASPEDPEWNNLRTLAAQKGWKLP